jgi:hypothetical protein
MSVHGLARATGVASFLYHDFFALQHRIGVEKGKEITKDGHPVVALALCEPGKDF